HLQRLAHGGHTRRGDHRHGAVDQRHRPRASPPFGRKDGAMTHLLSVRDLTVAFGQSTAVDSVSFTVDRGECLALVGESGSGKSVTTRTVVGLAGSSARVRASELSFDGTDLTRLPARAWRDIRGARIGLVLQDALGSLDPLRTVGREV